MALQRWGTEMIRIPCPNCGPRNSSEFSYFGELWSRPAPDAVDPAHWRHYLYDKKNPAGWTTEKWYHASGCRKFFAIERNTLTNDVKSGRPFGVESSSEESS